MVSTPPLLEQSGILVVFKISCKAILADRCAVVFFTACNKLNLHMFASFVVSIYHSDELI